MISKYGFASLDLNAKAVPGTSCMPESGILAGTYMTQNTWRSTGLPASSHITHSLAVWYGMTLESFDQLPSVTCTESSGNRPACQSMRLFGCGWYPETLMRSAALLLRDCARDVHECKIMPADHAGAWCPVATTLDTHCTRRCDVCKPWR
jgi:hypothetical protein